jgi:hypothetical protein
VCILPRRAPVSDDLCRISNEKVIYLRIVAQQPLTKRLWWARTDVGAGFTPARHPRAGINPPEADKLRPYEE